MDDLAGEYEVTPKDENLQDHDQTIIVELEPNLNTICYGFIKKLCKGWLLFNPLLFDVIVSGERVQIATYGFCIVIQEDQIIAKIQKKI